MLKKIIFAAALIIMLDVNLQAADAPSQKTLEEEGHEIVVVGLKNEFTLDSKTLNRVRDAYKRYQPALAPKAPLRFIADDLAATGRPRSRIYTNNQVPVVKTQERSIAYGPIHIWINNGDNVEDVDVSDDGIIAFPTAAYKNNAKILVNRRSSDFEVVSEVMSPGYDKMRRRIGDLRLQCQLHWAMISAQASTVIKLIFAAAGGACKSRRIGTLGYSAIPISSAIVRNGDKKFTLRMINSHHFVVPLYNKDVSDEAIVYLNK